MKNPTVLQSLPSQCAGDLDTGCKAEIQSLDGFQFHENARSVDN